MASDVFSPLGAVELTDARVPRRLLNYGGLIDAITDSLVADPVAGTKTAKARGFGRCLRVHGRFDVHLVVSFTAWRDHGITPLWCNCGSSKDVADELQARFDGARVDGSGSWVNVCIPIRLTAGVERDRVIDDAVRQMRRITDELKAWPGAALTEVGRQGSVVLSAAEPKR